MVLYPLLILRSTSGMGKKKLVWRFLKILLSSLMRRALTLWLVFRWLMGKKLPLKVVNGTRVSQIKVFFKCYWLKYDLKISSETLLCKVFLITFGQKIHFLCLLVPISIWKPSKKTTVINSNLYKFLNAFFDQRPTSQRRWYPLKHPGWTEAASAWLNRYEISSLGSRFDNFLIEFF